MELTQEDLDWIAAHLHDPDTDLRRHRRLSVQYLMAATLFMAAALLMQLAWVALPVWALFAFWLAMRLHAMGQRQARLTRILKAMETAGLLPG
ncbi:hypothetical protein [Pseudodonghicola flavimaris]|uniref:DUF3040 domain-containing protein n=1 Tax=Pseudodonghicola flavimaris TaxID=3050036 RepID=A0ABT7F4S8_9RHOB|nr:hypothetical protein [Pseudodonghicola flavimaris]MDK3019615.1 hypothetical protein [Pseudodonghicola flavimaris]